jgi:hypothetical protein
MGLAQTSAIADATRRTRERDIGNPHWLSSRFAQKMVTKGFTPRRGP